MLSVFRPAPAIDPETEKRIALTRMIGLPLVLGLAVVVWASLLMDLLPTWLGASAAIAETWVGSALIGRIRTLRKQAD
ncbi:MAG TPA: hypothetical protein VG345_09760 [Bryobacteraceae bacterium]|jgi:hypothetical protein|nr:hypothetical protein [Bryobacteraceae bacterium]